MGGGGGERSEYQSNKNLKMSNNSKTPFPLILRSRIMMLCCVNIPGFGSVGPILYDNVEGDELGISFNNS